MCLAGLLLSHGAVPAQQPARQSNLIIDTAFLKDKIGKERWVVVDLRLPNEYAAGHIPRAVPTPVWIPKLYADDTKRSPGVIPRLERAIGEMGIDNESHVILYGSRRSIHWNAVMFWLFETVGCNSPVSKCTVHFYDGGIEQWRAEGGTLEQAAATPKPASFQAAPGARRAANGAEIMQVVNGTAKAIVIDVRTAAEYEGTDVRALRGGHIPKSVSIDFDGNYDHESYRMKSLSELTSLYEKLLPDARLITYCQSGARAAYTYLVLRALGYSNVGVYHDGWRVYGSSLDLPVDDETWFDFTKVGATVKAVRELQEKERFK